MKPDPDEARLTAHALGELAAAESRAAEAAAWADPEKQEAIEETRAMAELLVFGFARKIRRRFCRINAARCWRRRR